MKIKSLAFMTALGLAAYSSSAFAGVDLQLNLGGPPVYAVPAPVYAAPPPVVYAQPYGYINHPYVRSWDPHHRASDYRYWHEHGHDHH